MSADAHLKRYRERRSLQRERQYLAKDWQALGTEPEKLDGSTACLAEARKAGARAEISGSLLASLDIGLDPAERERKGARVYRPTVGAGKA